MWLKVFKADEGVYGSSVLFANVGLSNNRVVIRIQGPDYHRHRRLRASGLLGSLQ